MSSQETNERRAAELELLQSMYPDAVRYDEHALQLIYHTDNTSLELRLPDSYLDTALPEILSANAGKIDLRDRVKHTITGCPIGEEVLDSIILAFRDISAAAAPDSQQNQEEEAHSELESKHIKVTIVVWLHHLLNTNKRKQALSPPSRLVSGVTKPGYPGVLVYAGPAEAVREHVNELKQLNWQAFQVRLEMEEEWEFTHGKGVIEVEAMKDLVAEIDDEPRKKALLEALKIK